MPPQSASPTAPPQAGEQTGVCALAMNVCALAIILRSLRCPPPFTGEVSRRDGGGGIVGPCPLSHGLRPRQLPRKQGSTPASWFGDHRLTSAMSSPVCGGGVPEGRRGRDRRAHAASVTACGRDSSPQAGEHTSVCSSAMNVWALVIGLRPLRCPLPFCPVDRMCLRASVRALFFPNPIQPREAK